MPVQRGRGGEYCVIVMLDGLLGMIIVNVFHCHRRLFLEENRGLKISSCVQSWGTYRKII